jgi:3-hydroxyisobutyrate dehydrogenase-like beta-hydroxyacid dehydrogenase
MQPSATGAAFMRFSTIGIVSPGDMGHGVGRALKESGRRVLTDLTGRSPRSRDLAASAGMEDANGLDALVASSDLVLSILPPASAIEFAERTAGAMRRTGATPLFADCNAISPQTAARVGAIVNAAGADFVDAGIIGSPPSPKAPTRLYVSGNKAMLLEEIATSTLLVRQLGEQIGQASIMKMLYSGLNKGYNALQAAVMIAAERYGMTGSLLAEFQASQKAAHDRMLNSLGFLAADAERWHPEMVEIAETFAAVGVTPKFHQGSEDVFRLLAETPLAAETRQTWDRTRPMETSIRIYAETLAARRPAAE